MVSVTPKRKQTRKPKIGAKILTVTFVHDLLFIFSVILSKQFMINDPLRHDARKNDDIWPQKFFYWRHRWWKFFQNEVKKNLAIFPNPSYPEKTCSNRESPSSQPNTKVKKKKQAPPLPLNHRLSIVFLGRSNVCGFWVPLRLFEMEDGSSTTPCGAPTRSAPFILVTCFLRPTMHPFPL